MKDRGWVWNPINSCKFVCSIQQIKKVCSLINCRLQTWMLRFSITMGNLEHFGQLICNNFNSPLAFFTNYFFRCFHWFILYHFNFSNITLEVFSKLLKVIVVYTCYPVLMWLRHIDLRKPRRTPKYIEHFAGVNEGGAMNGSFEEGFKTQRL